MTRSKRLCPRCRQALQPRHTALVDQLQIDICPAGHGAWYDQGELDRLLPMPVLRSRFIQIRKADKAAVHSYRLCPDCPGRLVPHGYHPESSLVIERCEQCNGFWLDRGEFQRIRLIQDWEARKQANTSKDRVETVLIQGPDGQSGPVAMQLDLRRQIDLPLPADEAGLREPTASRSGTTAEQQRSLHPEQAAIPWQLKWKSIVFGLYNLFLHLDALLGNFLGWMSSWPLYLAPILLLTGYAVLLGLAAQYSDGPLQNEAPQIVLSLGTILPGALAVFLYFRQLRFQLEAGTATGQVIGHREESDLSALENQQFYTIVEFTAQDGTSMRFEDPVSASWSRYTAGQKVPVLYTLDAAGRLDRAWINAFWSFWMPFLVSGVIAISFGRVWLFD
ncbi:MAG: zf-TFIIB domain-containing protein [Leptospiraceae bacterium]|nr:zf-TFIIB domain-containing protein [Leptospiraceae bacterium]